MVHRETAGRCKVTDRDIGNPVLTCFGQRVGQVESVSEQGAFTLTVTSETAPHFRLFDGSSEGFVMTLSPETVGLVTPDSVWLRI